MSKYGNRKTRFMDRVYDSKLEAAVAAELYARLRAGELMRIEYQVSFPFRVNGKLICRYVADFRITYADRRVEVVEAKGVATRTWALKEKLFRALYPDLPLTVVRSAS